MRGTLKIIAGLLVVLIGGVWLWGRYLLDQAALASTATALLLPLRAGLLCGLAWWVRSCRRRAAGWEAAIDSKLVRDRALGAVVLLVLCFVFALALDRLSDRPHQTFVWSAVAAAWAAIGIVGLIFCSVCLISGGKR